MADNTADNTAEKYDVCIDCNGPGSHCGPALNMDMSIWKPDGYAFCWNCSKPTTRSTLAPNFMVRFRLKSVD